MIAHGSLTRTRRTAASVLSALLIAVVAVLLPAAPASAHDALIGSDPASGATVDALPAQITLSFSAALLAEEGGTVVQVTDEAGASLTAGDATVDQNVVTQALAGEASGTVTVVWRVVSSDGHPVSGEYAFAVTAAATPTPTATEAAPTPTPSPSVAQPEETVTAVPISAPVDSDAGSVWPWVVGGIVLVAAVALVIWLLVARARQQERATRAQQDARRDRATAPDDETDR